MKTERGVIQVDPRHTARRIRVATQGSAIRALVELITNADDSYTRLEESGANKAGVIEILYQKHGRTCRFGVRDQAEGMSHSEVHERFTKYGGETSGMKTGRGVRGYFGQGAKDALASMEEGRLCTFKDGRFVECKVFIEKGKPMYELSGDVSAEGFLHMEHGVEENGTVAYFTASPDRTGVVPRFDTVHRELGNNFLLRMILTSRRRKVFLVDGDTGERRKLRYQMPDGTDVLVDNFTIDYGGHGSIPIEVCVKRSVSGDLDQAGDNRIGGLLILDELNVVLGISLFKYDNEPLAARLFGHVRIGSFRPLLEDEEPVLREDRQGLELHHSFCQHLMAEVEKRLENVVNQERTRRQKEEQSKIDREEANRFRTAFRILNEIAEIEAPGAINLGTQTDNLEEPPNGFAIYPASANITVGKRYNLQLHLSTRAVPSGATVHLECSSPKIRLITRDIIMPSNTTEDVVVRHITVEGTEPNTEGVLRATSGTAWLRAGYMWYLRRNS